MKKLVSIFLSTLFCVQLISCTNQNSQQNNSYDEKIDLIYNAIVEYRKENKISIFDMEQVIDDIEKITKSTFNENNTYGRRSLEFNIDEHLSFIIIDIPFKSCVFCIDDKEYRTYEL